MASYNVWLIFPVVMASWYFHILYKKSLLMFYQDIYIYVAALNNALHLLYIKVFLMLYIKNEIYN